LGLLQKAAPGAHRRTQNTAAGAPNQLIPSKFSSRAILFCNFSGVPLLPAGFVNRNAHLFSRFREFEDAAADGRGDFPRK